MLYFAYTLLEYTYSFNYLQTPGSGHYLMLPVATGLAVVTLFITLWQKKYFCTIVDLIVWLTICYCLLLLLLGSELYNFHQEIWCNTISFLSLFVVLRCIGNDIIQRVIFPVLLCFFVLEVCHGFSDLFDNINSAGRFLLIKGHLNNSGIYSIYLVLHLPLIRYFIFRYLNKKWSIPVLILIFSLVLLLVSVTTSRAAIIGAIVYFLMLLTDSNKIQPYRKQLIILSALVLLTLFGLLLYFKPASAFGRFVIWKITLKHFAEYVWTGIGYGQFPNKYPGWQIDYFANLPEDNLQEILSADEVFAAYNEPLQLLVELGFGGFLAIGALFALFLFKKPLQTVPLLTAIRGILLILFITSLFSYSIHVNTISIILVVCLAYASPLLFSKITLRYHYQFAFQLILLGLLSIVLVKSTIVFSNQKKWRAVQGDTFLSDDHRMATYRQLYPELKHNSKFLLDYGILIYSVQDRLSIKILEESKERLVTVDVLELMARIYMENKDIEKAILATRSLTNFVPFKFSYKEQLLNLYQSKNDLKSAKKTASLILAMPVKKNDKRVEVIKNKAHQFLSL